MVLLPQFSLDAFNALEHNAKGISNIALCNLEWLQVRYRKNYTKVYPELLLQQFQGSHSTPFYNNQTMYTGKSGRQLGRRREMPQDFPSYTHWHNQASIQQGKEKVIEIEEEKGREAENTEQDLVLSNVEKREERQSSLSFD